MRIWWWWPLAPLPVSPAAPCAPCVRKAVGWACSALAPGRRFLVLEQNAGQMVEDVRLALCAQPGAAAADVRWHGVMPGLFIGADALREPMLQALEEK